MQTLLPHPRLMDCRRLFLRDYAVWINIGVHDFEKKGEQRVLINVDLYVPLALSTYVLIGWLGEVRSGHAAALSENAFRFTWAYLGDMPVTVGV